MKRPQPAHNTRVEILVKKGAEELLPEELYTLSNPGIWLEEKNGNTLIKCYPEDVRTFLNHLYASGVGVMEVNVEKERLKDYEEITKKYFRAIKIEEVTILPPWHKRTTRGQHIIIEPGMAFGTGRHESTKLMFKLMRDVDMKGKKALDIGCGSGILSLYARHIGANKMVLS